MRGDATPGKRGESLSTTALARECRCGFGARCPQSSRNYASSAVQPIGASRTRRPLQPGAAPADTAGVPDTCPPMPLPLTPIPEADVIIGGPCVAGIGIVSASASGAAFHFTLRAFVATALSGTA